MTNSDDTEPWHKRTVLRATVDCAMGKSCAYKLFVTRPPIADRPGHGLSIPIRKLLCQ